MNLSQNLRETFPGTPCIAALSTLSVQTIVHPTHCVPPHAHHHHEQE